jgi:putative transposase
MTISFARH